jgi:hypothetical protein
MRWVEHCISDDVKLESDLLPMVRARVGGLGRTAFFEVLDFLRHGPSGPHIDF